MLGVDIVDIGRFTAFKKNSHFLLNNYSQQELGYCFSFKDPSPHLAGIFAAKEAVFKATNKPSLVLSNIEIRREKSGKPTVWIKNRRQKLVYLSISHSRGVAVAIALSQPSVNRS